MKKVFISIINFHNPDVTKNCLYSLEKIDTTNIELHVVIIDNGAKEPLLVTRGQDINFNIHIITNKENKGFSGGQNDGIKYALQNGADYIVVLNNDTRLDKDFLQELIKSAESHDKAGIIIPKIYFESGSEYHKDRYKANEKGKVFWYAGGVMDWKNVLASHRGVDKVDKGQYDTEEETAFATGCCMLVKKDVFEKVGLLDEKYFLYYEDNDFSQRAKKAGYTIIYSPKAKIWHINAASGGGSGSSLQDYFITRNRLLFGFRYAPFRSKIALVRESIRLMISGREAQKKGVKDFYLQRFGKGSFIH